MPKKQPIRESAARAALRKLLRNPEVCRNFASLPDPITDSVDILALCGCAGRALAKDCPEKFRSRIAEAVALATFEKFCFIKFEHGPQLPCEKDRAAALIAGEALKVFPCAQAAAAPDR